MSLKQGLTYLIEQAHRKGFKNHFDEKTVIVPIYSFINQLISSLRAFINAPRYDIWYRYFLEQNLNERTLSNMIRSWEKLKQTSLQCHLLQKMLIVRNKNKIKLYLKARKQVLHTSSDSDMIDDVLLTLQDSITIIYKLFQNDLIRKAIVTGIRNIFVAFKISEAKIYSTVLIEYLLSIYDSVYRLQSQEATISGQYNTYKSNQKHQQTASVQLYSSIQNFQSSIHEDNGLYKKTSYSHANHKKYQIIDRKFLPLKETSQYISSSPKSKFLAPSPYKKSVQREKSSFYEFVHKTTYRQEQQKISEQASDIQRVNNFYKSLDKRKQNQSHLNSIINKDHDFHKPDNENERKSQSMKRHAKKNVKIPPNYSPSKYSPNFVQKDHYQSKQTRKQFSLSFLSKKLFESSNSPSRESALRKSESRVKKQILQNQKEPLMFQKQKQPIISLNSTQRHQIQDYLLNQNTNQAQESRYHGNQTNNFQSSFKNRHNKSMSITQEQYERMVSKNQAFKQKMLRKNYPSGGKNSSYQGNLLGSYKGNIVSLNQNTQNIIVSFNGNSQRQVEFYSQNQSYPEQLFARSSQPMKNKNQRLLVTFNNLQERKKHLRQQNKNSQLQYEQQQYQQEPSQDQTYEKGRVIHKSIGQIRRKNSYNKNSGVDFYPNMITLAEEQNADSRVNKLARLNKMKQIMTILDDHNKRGQQSIQDDYLQESQAEASQSFFQKSKFQPPESPDSKQSQPSLSNYPFLNQSLG